MILTGSEIHKQVSNNKIHIKPFDEQQINPNSYNYRLGDNLVEILDMPIDPMNKTTTRAIEFNEDGYVLNPNKLYLANTYEEIGSSSYVTSLIGRSSLGRLGLFLQITADLGHLGAKHSWTLELKVIQPLRIYPRILIG
jgi:dCTP deaminase